MHSIMDGAVAGSIELAARRRKDRPEASLQLSVPQMAERVGVEPTVQLPVLQISNLVH